jgi:hypothetical protein
MASQSCGIAPSLLCRPLLSDVRFTPNAGIRRHDREVRFVPKADVSPVGHDTTPVPAAPYFECGVPRYGNSLRTSV